MSEVKHFLYRIQPTRRELLPEGPTEEESRVIGEHFRYLKNLTEKGVVVLAGRTLNTDQSSFGIVILKSDSEEVAKEIMENDPAVKHGVMKSEFFPYRLALFTEDFAGQFG